MLKGLCCAESAIKTQSIEHDVIWPMWCDLSQNLACRRWYQFAVWSCLIFPFSLFWGGLHHVWTWHHTTSLL